MENDFIDREAFRRETLEMRTAYEQKLTEFLEKRQNDPSPHGRDSEGDYEFMRQLYADIHRIRSKYGLEK